MERLKTLAEWLQELEISTDDLVKQTGLERRVIEAIASGRYTTSPKQRERLGNALDVDPSMIQWGAPLGVDHMYGHGPQFGRSP
ncbi:MAG: helix-turn-helix transcriptional regulator [Planctomycetota bacterium]|nr:helix-turn-helix transcriptional regulator [Planctomycetota bacterium]